MARFISLDIMQEKKSYRYQQVGISTLSNQGALKFFKPFQFNKKGAGDFGAHLLLPIVVPIVTLCSALIDIFAVVKSLLWASLNLAVLDSFEATDHLIQAINSLLSAIFYIYSAIQDTLITTTLLLTRTLATFGFGVATALGMSGAHPFIQLLKNLEKKPRSTKLNEFLLEFEQPHEFTLDVMKEGIQKFLNIANLDARAREEFYGSQWLGLHYYGAITAGWNNQSETKIQLHDLNFVAPAGWEVRATPDDFLSSGYLYLVYHGNNPAQGLQNLLAGTTLIDCNMFGQLAFWFGILYLLGNDEFNRAFGQEFFYITPITPRKSGDPFTPEFGNPLFDLFSLNESSTGALGPLSLGIEYIGNTNLYANKFQLGEYKGHNSVVIDGQYNIFDPGALQTQGLEKQTIEQSLLDAFNTRPDYVQYGYDNVPLNGREEMVIDQTRFYQTQKPGGVLAFDFLKLRPFIDSRKNPYQDDRVPYQSPSMFPADKLLSP